MQYKMLDICSYPDWTCKRSVFIENMEPNISITSCFCLENSTPQENVFDRGD